MPVRVDENLSVVLPQEIVDKLGIRVGDEIGFVETRDGRVSMEVRRERRVVFGEEEGWPVFYIEGGPPVDLNYDIAQGIRESREERTDMILGISRSE